jgi:mRNA-degrading endonuclease toxin of MazEF toxin-antitoxin module
VIKGTILTSERTGACYGDRWPPFRHTCKRCRPGSALDWDEMTPREKLHLLVDELSDAEAEAALARLVRERELLERWTDAEDAKATEDVWALANAREGDPRRALVARGEVAWLELEDEGRRPVVVLTREEGLPRLRNVVVALVTARSAESIEVELGPPDGMPIACAVSLDNLRTVPQALLTESITRLDAE